MKKTHPVKAEIVSPVHSRVHFCREAALVRISGPESRLECRRAKEYDRNYFDLYINGRLLLDGMISSISTCGAALRTGYGEGIMDDEACLEAAERVNRPYDGLEDAVMRIAPLMGLMGPGLYLAADFELQPVREPGMHALDARRYYDAEAKFSTGMCGERFDAPLYILPTQRAALLNPERIRYYMDEFEKRPEHQAHRAVALYLNGCVTLLLDGHHKAAAAAALGRRVRTLVIFPMEEEAAVKRALEKGTKFEFCHSRWDYEKDEIIDRREPAYLCDGSLQMISRVRCLWTTPGSDQAAVPSVQKEKGPEWGRVPEEFCARLHDYPHTSTLMHGTAIPPDRIKACMKRLEEQPWDDEYDIYGRALAAFARIFPESPMLNEKQRARLKKEWLKQYNRIFWNESFRGRIPE
ncbi:MAG: hypothetical protein IJE08_08010 [Clostridia bacterium]|nr:hypothetical protein [Clostridia bacterium]